MSAIATHTTSAISLVRALTTRRNKQDDTSKFSLHAGRAASQRAGKPVQRGLISSPVELVSTTNMLSYEAPNIAGTTPIGIRNVSSSVSDGSVSGEDSDASALTLDTDGTVTDASSIEQSPTTPEPKENHLSCYFNPAVNTQSADSSPNASTRPSFDAPAIPQRMPSHSKKAHERLHRQRSIQRMMSPVRRSSTESSDRTSSHDADFSRESPFGSELAQLDEIAEEFGQALLDAEIQADNVVIKTLSLGIFSAQDYEIEIAADVSLLLDDEEQEEEPATWI